MWIDIPLLVLALWLLGGLATAVILPRRQAARQRQQVADQVRLTQWRLQQTTSAAMQRLLDEARRRS